MIYFLLSLLFLYRHVSETVTIKRDISPSHGEPVNAGMPRLTHILGMCS